MTPPRQPRSARRAGQAALGLLAALVLVGCDAIRQSTPVQVGRDIFGIGPRPEPAPGSDRPFPNLASVPARPTPPDAATRAAMTAALADDRAASRTALAPRTGVAAFAPGTSVGDLPMALAPPGPPALPTPQAIPAAIADPFGGGPTGQPRSVPASGSAPAGARALQPGAIPPSAPPELFAPPPPPPADLLAPPRLR